MVAWRSTGEATNDDVGGGVISAAGSAFCMESHETYNNYTNTNIPKLFPESVSLALNYFHNAT